MQSTALYYIHTSAQRTINYINLLTLHAEAWSWSNISGGLTAVLSFRSGLLSINENLRRAILTKFTVLYTPSGSSLQQMDVIPVNANFIFYELPQVSGAGQTLLRQHTQDSRRNVEKGGTLYSVGGRHYVALLELPEGSSSEETHQCRGYSEMIRTNGSLMGTTAAGQNISLPPEYRYTPTAIFSRKLGSRGRIEGYSQRIHIDDRGLNGNLFEQKHSTCLPIYRSKTGETKPRYWISLREQGQPLGKIEARVCSEVQEECTVEQIMRFTDERPLLEACKPSKICEMKLDHFSHGKRLDMDLRVAEKKSLNIYSLNANPSITPVSQKRRVFCSEKSQVVTKEVAEWLKAGIVRPVKYPTWISNPVLMPLALRSRGQVQASLRACSVPNWKKIGSICGQHGGKKQVRKGDASGYCESNSDRPPEVSTSEISNPKKEFILESRKDKFLGYMVTSEGIRANPTKTKDITEMQSPKTWGEMQSLAGKLAALNRFLSRSAEDRIVSLSFEPLKGQSLGKTSTTTARQKKQKTLSKNLRRRF
ncbi:hypothetical protein Tco_0742944 [Tanacetum coccineum]